MEQGDGAVEDVVADGVWRGKRVFLTGHTGFKGGWLALWLHAMGAEVRGYSLDPATEPSLFAVAKVGSVVEDVRGDIRDGAALDRAMGEFRPEVVFHMAAQPLVRLSYADPIGTFETNVMGTARVLDAVRRVGTVRAVVSVTTDKCYENKEWLWGYRETDPLGGYDPYSSSKACAEIVSAAFRQSYFPPGTIAEHGVGGGDGACGERDRGWGLVGGPADSGPGAGVSGGGGGTHSEAGGDSTVAACARAAGRVHSAGGATADGRWAVCDGI